MTSLAIIGLINFNDWDSADYKDTGGVNSVIKSILPYLRANRIYLYGFTHNKNELFKEKHVAPGVVSMPIIYKAESNILPNRILGFALGWRLYRFFERHKINFTYSHSEELCFWLSFGNHTYIHHLHTYVNALKVSGGRLAKVQLFQKLWDKIRIHVIKKSFKIVAVNPDVVSMGKNLIGISRVIRFPNYVDMKQFTFRPNAGLGAKMGAIGKKVALHIGRLTKVKGLELFIDSIELLNKSAQKDEWIGILIGNGDYEHEIKGYVKNKGLEGAFIFTGSINNIQALSEFYTLATVFLITSRSESVPLTLLESLSCGTPVVSTNVGIANDVLGRNNGFVSDSRDVQMFARLVAESVKFKSSKNLLPNPYHYSVEYASALLNKEFQIR
jgi:glycosyltransferase involved in cell wall biosynthesis